MHFSGDIRKKSCFENFRRFPAKQFSYSSFWVNWTVQSITYNLLKSDSIANCFLFVFLEFWKLLWERLRWNHFLIIQHARFLYSATLPKTPWREMVCFENSSSKDFEKLPFNRSCKLKFYRNTTKNELLNKFLTGVLKISRKSSLMEFLFSTFQVHKLESSALRVLQILKNSWDNILFTKAGAYGFSTEQLLRTAS